MRPTVVAALELIRHNDDDCDYDSSDDHMWWESGKFFDNHFRRNFRVIVVGGSHHAMSISAF